MPRQPTLAPKSTTWRCLVAHPGLTVGVRSEVVVSREGLRVREVSNEEGNRLLRIVRRSSGSVVTWRRAQMVLLSVQGMDVAGIAKVDLHQPRPGPGGHKQLQRGRL